MPSDSSDQEFSLAPPPRIARSYLFLTEALFAHSRLDFAGIDVLLLDETLARFDWIWLNGRGGVRRMVPGGEAETAAPILAAPFLPVSETEDGKLFPQPRRPRGGSLDVAYRPTTQS